MFLNIKVLLIKKIKNLLDKQMIWIYEMKTYIAQKKENILNYIQKKSVERLTIMFIPHGNDKIYSFHLSFLMIIFLTFLFTFLLCISLYGYYRYKEISDKIAELKKLYGKNYQNTFNIQTSLNDIQKEIKNQVHKNLKEFYNMEVKIKYLPISYQHSIQKSDLMLNTEIRNNKELKPNTKYLKATYISSAIKNHLIYNYEIINLVKNLLIEKMNLLNEIPNGRPVQYFRFRDTSPYGLRLDPVTKNRFEFHAGMDMAGNYKEPIYNTADGKVYKVFYDYGYGYAVIIKHQYGYYSLYGHLAKPLVKTNQILKKGDLIGLMGSTGRVTGVHLHYEILINDMERINPLPFVCSSDIKTYKCKNYNKNFINSEEEL